MNFSRIAQRRNLRIAACIAIISLALVLDQATKAVIRATIPVGQSRPFISGLLELRHIENAGAAFGMGQGASLVFALIACAVLAAVVWAIWRHEMPGYLVCFLSCVAGGGLGNLVDRLAKGTVTDFFCTTFVDFPVFNVADIFVTCGVILSFVGYTCWELKLEHAERTDGERGEEQDGDEASAAASGAGFEGAADAASEGAAAFDSGLGLATDDDVDANLDATDPGDRRG